jgi:hypothetical protein
MGSFKFDTNKDGVVNSNEFLAGLIMLKVKVTKDEVRTCCLALAPSPSLCTSLCNFMMVYVLNVFFIHRLIWCYPFSMRMGTA